MDKGLFKRLQGELDAREKTPGLTMADILLLPEPLAKLINWMMRKDEVELSDVCSFLQQDEKKTNELLNDLLNKGFIRKIEMHGTTRYRVRLAPKPKRELPKGLWHALDDKVDKK